MFLTTKEVALHNRPDDIWVSAFERVYNLTSLVEAYGPDSHIIKPLLMFAGKDVSHWFDKETMEFLHYTDVITGTRLLFAPHGLVPHSILTSPGRVPWWKDEARQVGCLTKRMRLVRIINTLTGLSTLLETCSEDTCDTIKERYKALGYDVSDEAYMWRSASTGQEIVMALTLEENGIPDESEYFVSLGLPTDLYVPALLLYYTDVITEPIVPDC